MSDSDKKHYLLVDYKVKKIFEAKTPGQAAKKAFNFLLKDSNFDLKNEENMRKVLVFTIKDIEKDKMIKYAGKRIKLRNPIVREISGKRIVFQHKNIVSRFDNEISSQKGGKPKLIKQ